MPEALRPLRDCNPQGTEETIYGDVAYLVHNPPTPNQGPMVDSDLCLGCNACVNACRSDEFVPNSKEGQPLLVLYPDECWLCGCCVSDCPSGALEMEHPLNRRVGWKRREAGESFIIGVRNPSPPNNKPPMG